MDVSNFILMISQVRNMSDCLEIFLYKSYFTFLLFTNILCIYHIMPE